MMVRLRTVQKLSASDYRLTLDVADDDRQAWDFGDCALRIDLHDGPAKHLSSPRGLLRPAFELYSLSPDDPPTSTEARLLWEIGDAVHKYVDRVFEAGILCPFKGRPADAPERSEILSQGTAQVRNKTIVERIAQECDLALSGFRSDATLELYFDMARERQEIGYIAKGWDDPGFRIGTLIQVHHLKAFTLIANAFQAMKICATNGIGTSVHETMDSIDLCLDGVIYSEGFNRDTFIKTLDSLSECEEKIKALIGGAGS